MRTILSIDGGGIRGLIGASLLAELEAAAGAPCASLFDLIAGTSTGGILALGLTCPAKAGRPYPADDLAELYLQNGRKIFSRSVEYEIESAGGLLRAKYEVDGIEAVLKEYFGDTVLRDARTAVLVTSYDTERPGPAVLTGGRVPTFPVRQAARATSAAPTYFRPLCFEGRCLVDGGVWANNPALCAWLEARRLWPGEELLVVSIGTGYSEAPLSAGDWGLAEWARPLVGILLDGEPEAVDMQLAEMLPADRYFRFQCSLGGVNGAMDDASDGTMNALVGLGKGLAATHRLKDLAQILTSRDRDSTPATR